MTNPGSLDSNSLRCLRTLLHETRGGDRKALPLAELAALADLPPDTSVTIDFEAAGELGHPLVVLRPRAEAGVNVLELLSPREREVAVLVASALSNKEIAARLYISLGTVKDHVHRILEKTEQPNRTSLALAIRSWENVPGTS